MNQIGKYVVVREIGRGGMGVVYEARDPALDRPVALKLVNDRADPKRFLVEAKAAAKVIHPNLVPIFDLGEHDGRPFLVMELIHGATAAEFSPAAARCDGRRPRASSRACRRLAAIHEAGLVPPRHQALEPPHLEGRRGEGRGLRTGPRGREGQPRSPASRSSARRTS